MSYLNVDVLYMRLFLILAAVFFIIWAILIGNIFVDAVVYNSVFVIINLTYSLILIKRRYFKVKLDPLEERIYEKDFKRVMDRSSFRDFMKLSYLRTYNEEGEIIHQGNNFSSVFYVAAIHPNYKVTYYKNKKEYLSVKENAWIGVVEFSMMEKEDKRIANIKINDPNNLQYTNGVNHKNIINNIQSYGNKNLYYENDLKMKKHKKMHDINRKIIGEKKLGNLDDPLQRPVEATNRDQQLINRQNAENIVMDHRGYGEVKNTFRNLFFMGSSNQQQDYSKSGLKRGKLKKEEKVRQEKKNIMKSLTTKIKWGLSAQVSRIEEDIIIEDDFYEDCEDPVYVYEFSIRNLRKAFKCKERGIVYKNALYSSWLTYTTYAMMNVDNKLITAMKAKEAKVINVPGVPKGVIVVDNIPDPTGDIKLAPTLATEGVTGSAETVNVNKEPIYEMHDPFEQNIGNPLSNNNFNYEGLLQTDNNRIDPLNIEPVNLIKMDYTAINEEGYIDRLPEQYEAIPNINNFTGGNETNQIVNALEINPIINNNEINNNFNNPDFNYNNNNLENNFDNEIRPVNIIIESDSVCESCDASSFSEVKSEGISNLEIEIKIKQSTNNGNF